MITLRWLLLLSLLCTSSANADILDWAQRKHHRWWISLSFGPTFGVSPAKLSTTVFGFRVEDKYTSPTQLKLIQTIGTHLLKDNHGLAVALDLQESVGSNHFIFQFVPRVCWDFVPFEDRALYISPSLGIGFIHMSRRDTVAGDGSGNGFTFQIAVEGRMTLPMNFVLLVKPLVIDVQPISFSAGQVQDWGTFVRYDFLIGGGLTF